MTTEAGKGEHNVYTIQVDNNDQEILTAGKHYISIYASSWFVNKENNWFSKNMASGTLDIWLSNGQEKYQTALGTFQLKGGSKIAPVFNKPVLLERRYRGGNLGFRASLTAIKKDTVLAGVLKNAANASLGIVAGMIDTASVAGPTQLLSEAGGELVKGVKEILSDKSDRHIPFFDFSGLEITIDSNNIKGKDTYLLLHRGAELDEEKLKITDRGQTKIPEYNGSELEDGAWLLLNLKRNNEYSNERPWFLKRRELKNQISAVVNDVVNQFKSKEEGLREFKYSSSGDSTLLDKYANLRTLISNDGALTELQGGTFKADLTNLIVNARKSIEESDIDIYNNSMIALSSIETLNNMDDSLEGIISDEIYNLSEYRKTTLLNENLPEFSNETILSELKNMPHMLKEFGK